MTKLCWGVRWGVRRSILAVIRFLRRLILLGKQK